MILVVLVQGGNQGGVGAAFGGGNSQSFFGATGAVTLLGKLTYGAALIFMATSLTLTIFEGGSQAGLAKRMQQSAEEELKKAADEAAAFEKTSKPQAPKTEPVKSPEGVSAPAPQTAPSP